MQNFCKFFNKISTYFVYEFILCTHKLIQKNFKDILTLQTPSEEFFQAIVWLVFCWRTPINCVSIFNSKIYLHLLFISWTNTFWKVQFFFKLTIRSLFVLNTMILLILSKYFVQLCKYDFIAVNKSFYVREAPSIDEAVVFPARNIFTCLLYYVRSVIVVKFHLSFCRWQNYKQ